MVCGCQTSQTCRWMLGSTGAHQGLNISKGSPPSHTNQGPPVLSYKYHSYQIPFISNQNYRYVSKIHSTFREVVKYYFADFVLEVWGPSGTHF